MSTATLEDIQNDAGYLFLMSICVDGYDHTDKSNWPADWLQSMVDLAGKVDCHDAIYSFGLNSPQEWFARETRVKYARQRRYGVMGIITSHLAHVNKEVNNLNEIIQDLMEE